MTLPLADVRVLDFTMAWAGPFATRGLAYLGAQVIKIEGPTKWDMWRGAAKGGYPSRYPNLDPGPRPYNRAVFFNTQNHDKLSLGINLKRPGAREIILRLAKLCDVAIANFSPRALEGLGLGYRDLCQVRPDIIMVEMPAYGNDGPLAHHLGIGPNMEGMTGMAALMGYGDGTPTLTGIAYLDPIGGLHAAAAVLTALAYRRRTGKGQYIELAQREGALHWIGEFLLDYAENGRVFQPDGNHRPGYAPHDAFPCRGEDEWVAIAVSTDEQWQALCRVIQRPDLATDPRFATLPERWRNQELLDESITAWTRERDKHEIAQLLQSHGVPAAPVQMGKDIAEDPHLIERGFFAMLDHPEAGRHVYSGLGFRLKDTPGAMRTAAPCFGQHNRQILIDLLGMTEAEVQALEAAGVIADEIVDAS
ncbi:MAG TPA: CoA transferase [Chloroflexota bacterium]|nr:CoA transferase [Chloroflexota bacterium]